MKENAVLRYHSDVFSQGLYVDVFDVLPIDKYITGIRFKKSVEKSNNWGFPVELKTNDISVIIMNESWNSKRLAKNLFLKFDFEAKFDIIFSIFRILVDKKNFSMLPSLKNWWALFTCRSFTQNLAQSNLSVGKRIY